MKVFVDSPDRKHRGIVDVKVELPQVQYGVINYNLLAQGIVNQLSSSTGQNTDYIMTAANRQVYGVYPFIFDARGNPIIGERSVECGSSTSAEARLTRFTPFNTINIYDILAIKLYNQEINYELF